MLFIGTRSATNLIDISSASRRPPAADLLSRHRPCSKIESDGIP
jgi:hypothetical protein